MSFDAIQASLDTREDFNGRRQRAENNVRGSVAAALTGHDEAARLLRFDAWLRAELAARIDWTWAAGQRERRIEQCRVYLERLVIDLWRRGWMFDGKRLATHLQACLEAVATYQQRGTVKDFWAYSRAAVDRYVGGNAEELQAEAMRAGAHIGQLLGGLGIKRGSTETPLPELVARRHEEIGRAKSLREQQAEERRARKAAATDSTGLLF